MQCVTASTHTTSTTEIIMPAELTQQSAIKPTKATKRPAKVRKVVQAKVEGEARASWSTEDEGELIQFLIKHKVEVGNGFNFKTVVFNAASLVLDPMKTKGALKTSKVCKNKWMQVCPSP